MGALQEVLARKAALSPEAQADPNRFASEYGVIDGTEGKGLAIPQVITNFAEVAAHKEPPVGPPLDLSEYVKHTELEASFTGFAVDVNTLLDNQRLATRELVTSSIAPIQSAISSLEERMKARHKTVVLAAGREPVELGMPTHEAFERITKRLAAGCHVMLVGPTQCGKTTLAAQVATGLDLPFSANSMSAGTKESDLFGWLLPTAANGTFEYHQAPFVNMFEQGGVQLFDEMDAADPNLMLAVNMALTNKRMFIPHRGASAEKLSPEVWASDWFRCIACVNTWGTGADSDYVGRNPLDAATLARFIKVLVDYDPLLEFELYNQTAVSTGHIIRANIRKHRLRRVLTTKTLDNWTLCLDAGISMEECVTDFLLGWTVEEQKLAMEKNPEATEVAVTQQQVVAARPARPAPPPRAARQAPPRPTANKAQPTGLAAQLQADPMGTLFTLVKKGAD